MSPLQVFLGNAATFAAVQVLVGWWLKARLEESVQHEYDRRLEQFKSRETLVVEIAKLRVAALAEAWRRLALFEVQCWKQSKDVAHRLLALASEHGANDIPAVLPVAHKDIFDLLASVGPVSIPDARVNAMQLEAKPEQDRLLALADDVDAHLSSNRFWIGSDLDRELREYAQTVRDAFNALGPEEEERREFVRLLHIVGEKRWDARSLVARLVASDAP